MSSQTDKAYDINIPKYPANIPSQIPNSPELFIAANSIYKICQMTRDAELLSQCNKLLGVSIPSQSRRSLTP